MVTINRFGNVVLSNGKRIKGVNGNGNYGFFFLHLNINQVSFVSCSGSC